MEIKITSVPRKPETLTRGNVVQQGLTGDVFLVARDAYDGIAGFVRLDGSSAGTFYPYVSGYSYNFQLVGILQPVEGDV